MKTIGIILVAIGVVMMCITGFNLISEKEVANIGPLEINKEEKTPVRWSPIVGALLIVGGVGCIVSSRNRSFS